MPNEIEKKLSVATQPDLNEEELAKLTDEFLPELMALEVAEVMATPMESEEALPVEESLVAVEEAVPAAPKRGRGRPRKDPNAVVVPAAPKRGRGRPRKEVAEVVAPKRGRGRPRKDPNAVPAVKAPAKSASVIRTVNGVEVATVKRRPGRPSKKEQRSVRFVYHGLPGAQVFLAGEFNHWDIAGCRLVDDGRIGLYVCDILLSPGQYQYKLVVNGRWITDVENPLRVANPYGTDNSLIIVE